MQYQIQFQKHINDYLSLIQINQEFN